MSPKETFITRKWTTEVYGKIAATCAAAFIIAVAAYVWSAAGAFRESTSYIYRQVPRQDRILYGPSPRPRVPEDYPGLIREVEALKAQAMPPGLAKRLDTFLTVQENKKAGK